MLQATYEALYSCFAFTDRGLENTGRRINKDDLSLGEPAARFLASGGQLAACTRSHQYQYEECINSSTPSGVLYLAAWNIGTADRSKTSSGDYCFS